MDLAKHQSFKRDGLQKRRSRRVVSGMLCKVYNASELFFIVLVHLFYVENTVEIM